MRKKNTNKGKNIMNKKNKLFEYMTVVFAVLGTLSMVAAVGAVESNQWLIGASALCIGIASFVMSIFSQSVYADK